MFQNISQFHKVPNLVQQIKHSTFRTPLILIKTIFKINSPQNEMLWRIVIYGSYLRVI